MNRYARRMPVVSLALLVTLLAAPLSAQRPGERFMLEIPGMKEATVLEKRTFASPGGTPLYCDVYRPQDVPLERKLPVVVFLNGVGDNPRFVPRTFFQYTGWGRLMAASGFAAVNHDSRTGFVREDMRSLLEYLRAHAAELGIDASNIGLWACSANVTEASRFVMNEKPAGVRCAVFYYGVFGDTLVRSDLPVQYVKSEFDMPQLNQGLDASVRRLHAAEAPLEFIVAAGCQHAFDVRDDNDLTRNIMRSTIDFYRTWLDPKIQHHLEATAETRRVDRLYRSGKWAEAAPSLAARLEAEPQNGELASRLAQCHYNLKNFEGAAGAYMKAADLGYGIWVNAYNAACCLALTGRKEEALAYLKKSRDARPTPAIPDAWQDTDLESLRSDPRFAEIVGAPPN